MRLRGYKLKELTDRERHFLRHLMGQDLKKARDYIRLCQECPSDDGGPNNFEAVAWETLKDLEAIYQYLSDKGHAWNDDYLSGYIKAYLMGKAASLAAELDKAASAEAIKNATPGELAETNAKAADLLEARAILAGRDCLNLDEQRRAAHRAAILTKHADLVRQLETYQDQGPTGQEIAAGLLEDMTAKKAITKTEAKYISDHLKTRASQGKD